jgi:hypothetical protein
MQIKDPRSGGSEFDMSRVFLYAGRVMLYGVDLKFLSAGYVVSFWWWAV